jgi:DNA-binding HxlR family transcriptional regulator
LHDVEALSPQVAAACRSLPVVPPHVEYTLTDHGMQAAARVEALADWIENSLPALAKGASAAPSR